MTKLKIPNIEVQELLAGKVYNYPKYVTQILNLANQIAQGTRAKVVGQMSDLIQEFEGVAMAEWEKWYIAKHPNAIDNATDKVMTMVDLFKQSINTIDRDMVRLWIEHLVIVKTFSGLRFQEAILIKMAEHMQVPYKLATPAEEAKGIDGFVNNKPVSIKPSTYRKMGLNESFEVPVVYYEKKKSEIVLEFDPENFL